MGRSEILEDMIMIPDVLFCGRYKLDTDDFISGGSPRTYTEHTLSFSSYKLDTEISFLVVVTISSLVKDMKLQ